MHSRKALVDLAEDTLKIIEAGVYNNGRNVVSISSLVENAVSGTILYTPSERESLVQDAWGAVPTDVGGKEVYVESTPTEVIVRNCTTLEAVRDLIYNDRTDRVCALNFASAKRPGGGFREGARAQEESLARSSGLYPCLEKCPEFYTQNKNEMKCVYTNHVIYSPDVPIFRNDAGILLPVSHACSFITAPAVNWGAAQRRVSPSTMRDEMLERTEMVLAIAAKHKHDTLVLGAWGCGVFQFPVLLLAEIFYSLISAPGAIFSGLFKKVVHAITHPDQVSLFRNVMENGISDKMKEEIDNICSKKPERPIRNNRNNYNNNQRHVQNKKK